MESDASESVELPSLNNQPAAKDSKQAPASTLISKTEANDELNPVKYAQIVTESKMSSEKVNNEAFSSTWGSIDNQSEPEPSTLHNPNNQSESELSTSPNLNSQPEQVSSPVLNPKSQSEPEPPTVIEAKYYHIDSFINQLKNIQLESSF